MIEQKKTYGFTIAIKELRETVPNIFRYASAYMRNNNVTSKGLWEMFLEPRRKKPEVITDLPDEVAQADPGHGALPEIHPDEMEGDNYNMCHFWSNFEIARLSWFRSKEYQDFFETMDRSGGFWMERVSRSISQPRAHPLTNSQWGDAPIHSLAAGALLGPEDVHYFRDIGYRHTTIQHCPANAPEARQLPPIPYLDPNIKDEKKRAEEDAYWGRYDEPQENGVGCRCRCDTDIVDVEGKEGSCMAEWVDVVGGWASP